MTVPSYGFLAFAAIVAIVINISNAAPWRRVVLLVANLAFVASFTHDPVALAPFAVLLALGFAGVKFVERWKDRVGYVALVLALIFGFCLLKRYAFVPGRLDLPFAYFTVGMSYVFFRILSVVIDAYQDALPGRMDLLSYANYTLNFTALVAGPIQSFHDYRRTESVAPLAMDGTNVRIGIERIVTGFLKVGILSPLFSFAQARCIAALSPALSSEERAGFALLIVALFPLYLYVNFSGYTDVVIGVARFLRLELPENFDRPFRARGFIEFWGRWHMTLSNWLKTYVYSSLLLGLMRRFPSQRVEQWLGVLAYFVTFFLVGVWHGQTTMFLFFGVLQGLGVSVNKLYQLAMTRRLGRSTYRTLCANPVYAAFSRGLTFAWFAFTLLWFWSTWTQLGTFVGTVGPLGVAAGLIGLIVAATLVLWLLDAIESSPALAKIAASPYAKVAWFTALATVTVSATVLLNAPAPHIIYRAF